MHASLLERFEAAYALVWTDVQAAKARFDQLLADAVAAGEPELELMALEGQRVVAVRAGDDAEAERLELAIAHCKPSSSNWLFVSASEALRGHVEKALAAAREAEAVAASTEERAAAREAQERLAARLRR